MLSNLKRHVKYTLLIYIHEFLFLNLIYLKFIFADDRFILKQMSRLEVQSFVEFAPFYFQYITKSRSEQVNLIYRMIFLNNL